MIHNVVLSCFQKSSTRDFSRTTVSGWGIDLEVLALARHLNFKNKRITRYMESQDESTLKSHAFLYIERTISN